MKPIFGLLGVAFLLGGCGESGARSVVGHQGSPASIALSLSSAEAMSSTGDTRTVTAVVRDDRQSVITAPLVWRTSAPAVATVSRADNGATITAVDDGTATITAIVGTVQKSVTVTVRRVLASVALSAPLNVLVFGSSMPLTAIALDARQHSIIGATAFTYATSNLSAVVSPDGIVTAIFRFPNLPAATLTATLTRDGVTASGTTNIRVSGPPSFEFASLLLTDYVLPTRPPGFGAGVAFFSRDGDRITYQVTWSELSGPATQVQIRGPARESEVAELLVDLEPTAQLNNYGVANGVFTGAHILSQGGRPAMSLDSLAALMCNQKAYIEVRTRAHNEGEVRGQSLCAGPAGALATPYATLGSTSSHR